MCFFGLITIPLILVSKILLIVPLLLFTAIMLISFKYLLYVKAQKGYVFLLQQIIPLICLYIAISLGIVLGLVRMLLVRARAI